MLIRKLIAKFFDIFPFYEVQGFTSSGDAEKQVDPPRVFGAIKNENK